MINGSMDSNLSDMLSRVSAGLKTPIWLEDRLAEVVLRGNAKGIGTDLNGNPLAPLKDSTKKRRKGSGPPLAPEGLTSDIVTKAQVTSKVGTGVVDVQLSWNGLDWLQFATDGTRYAPARNIVGFRPETLKEINLLLADYWKEMTE